jgi:hypothetical protein
MIRLKIYSLILILFLSFVVAQEVFGTPELKDEDGNLVEPSINSWGGSDFEVGSGQSFNVNYGGSEVSYNPGKYVSSEYGKIVEAEFTALDDGPTVLGNLKLNLKKGAKVVFKDGELSILDPGEMLDKDDVDFIDSESGWDDNNLKLSGDGVDYMGLDSVKVDEYGYFLEDPSGVEFDDFTVNGKGKVYFLSGGEYDLDIPGSYISVDPDGGRFSIGSNQAGESLSVMPKKENHYGIKSDIDSDRVAFKVVGGTSSFVSVQNMESSGLIPKVEVLGNYAIDDNHKAIYGIDGKIYNVPNGNVIDDYASSEGSTPSPLEIHLSHLDADGNVVTSVGEYSGTLIFGNDGAIGYGMDPSYVLAGKYEGISLYHGASNTLSYNYYAGGSELITELFGVQFDGGRVNVLDDPANGKYLMDIMFQTPPKYRQNLRSMTLKSHYVGALAWGSPSWIGLAVDKGAFTHDTIAHELGHVYDMNYGDSVDNMVGRRNVPVLKGAYSSSSGERYSTFLEQRFQPLDTYWQANYNGNVEVQRAVAAFTINEGMTFQQGKGILEAIGAGEINDMNDVQGVLG